MILWLSGVSPVGVDSGLALYSSGLAGAVASCGHSIAAIGLGRSGRIRDVDWTGVDSPMCSRLSTLRSPNPYIAARLDTEAHRPAIIEVLDRKPRFVVFDHLMSAWALDLVAERIHPDHTKLVHVSHNDEHLVRTRWARGIPVTSPKGIYLRFDARRASRLQRRLLDSVELVSAITDVDSQTMGRRHPRPSYIVLTPGADAPAVAGDPPPLAERPRSVVLLGSLDWEAKRQNVIEVVESLDQQLAQAGIGLSVVGGGDDEFVASQQGRWKATKFTGRVDDLDAELARHRIGLVAEPIGGGFKLKSLDYINRGLPMLVLDGSMSGTGLEPGRHYRSVSALKDMSKAIVESIDDAETLETLASAAAVDCAGRFDWSARGHQFSAALETLGVD